ncbi:MAG TPA: adenylosuccinate lyase, partial [Desulfurivibrionaceae bacterium]|nr:adenylosuccinate lyase [Desulfurivibrionaceae bacterium]
EEGGDNDLLERLGGDPDMPFTHRELVELVGDGSEFTGRAEAQVEEYLVEVVEPRLANYRDLLGETDSTLAV